MDWLLSNWIWIAFGFAMIAMHMFGRHGGHGGHSGHTRNDQRDPSPSNEPTPPRAELASVNGTALDSLETNTPAPLGGPDHAGHVASPTPANVKRHRHGC